MNKKLKEIIYRDFKNHFVGTSRMTLKQFERWIENNWKKK